MRSSPTRAQRGTRPKNRLKNKLKSNRLDIILHYAMVNAFSPCQCTNDRYDRDIRGLLRK
ncbi:MAG: hypothetical protein NZ455_10030 [Bacteroidia bacterium]|nr:hypothetical protein [Bacteroidia bacterium]